MSCVVTEADQVAAVYAHIRPRPWMKYLGLVLALMLSVLFLLALPSLIGHGALRSPPLWAGVFAIAYVPLYLLLLLPRRVRRLYRQTKEAGSPTTFSVSPTALGLTSSHGTAEVPWPNLHRWKESRHCVLLYINEGLYLILPKRCFSPEQLDILRSHLLQHVRRAA